MRALRICLTLALFSVSASGVVAQQQAGGLNGFGTRQDSGTGLSGFGTFGSLMSSGGQTGAGTGATTLGGAGFGEFDTTFGAAQIANGLIGGASIAGGLVRTNSALGLSGLGGALRLGGGGFGAGGRGGSSFNNQNNQNNKPSVRAVVRLGFAYPGIDAQVVNQQVNDRLSRTPLPGDLQARVRQDGLRVEMEGRTAVLRGEVTAQEDGDLLARLLALEPGIDDVRNELVSMNNAEEVPSPVLIP